MSIQTVPVSAGRRSVGADHRRQHGEGPAAVPPGRHLMWLGIGVVVSFAVPYVLADQLDLPRDVYYGLYAAFTLALWAAWMRDTHQAPHELSSRLWRWAVGFGIVFAAVSVMIVLASADATSHPGGVEFPGAIVWRGIVYGAIDGLLLSAFPILVVSAALAGSKLRGRRAGGAAVLARDGGFAAHHRDVPSRLQRLPLVEAAQAGHRRPRLERSDARHAQSGGSTHRARRAARRGRRAQLRHRPLPATASS